MNLANALLINDGWCDPPDLEWLAVRAAHHHRICEVGSWHGRSTMCLADNSPSSAIIFAVDTWCGSEEHRNALINSDPALYADFCKRAYDAFCTNLRPHIDSGKVIPVHLPSVEAARIFRALGVTFDMTFIDAAHDYENIHADILAWKPLTKGLLCGHDAGHGPVMQATSELIPHRRHECSMWMVET